MVYRSDCRYLPYSVHFSEFMPIFFFTRKRAKYENTRSPPFSCDTKMATDGYSQSINTERAKMKPKMPSFSDIPLRWCNVLCSVSVNHNNNNLYLYEADCYQWGPVTKICGKNSKDNIKVACILNMIVENKQWENLRATAFNLIKHWCEELIALVEKGRELWI